jgi:outer membrane lipoprotein-sorting protein
MVDRYHLGMLALAVGLGLVLSASVGTTAGEPDAEELLEKAVDSLENESIEAVHRQRISRPTGEITQTIIVHQRSSEGRYLEILDQTGDEKQRMVFNGSTIVQRDTGDGTTVQYRTSGEYLFDEFRTIGANPEAILDHYEGEVKGTAKIDGRESYVVELSPPKKTTAALSLDIHAGSIDYELPIHEAKETEWYLSEETWWIDKETFYPIKQTVKWTDKRGNVIATATRTSEELEVGSAVDGNPIEPEPATTETGFTLTDTEDNTTNSGSDGNTSSSTTKFIEPDVFETYYAVNAAIPFELPSVDIPELYSFDRGVVRSHEGDHGVMLLYTEEETDAKLSVRIVDGNSSLFQHNTVIQSENVSGFDGKIVVTGSGTEVVRQCDDLTYRVRGPPDADTLIQVTKSIECD